MRKSWVYDVHHRKCRSNGGTDDPKNLIRVPTHFHRAWHLLFKNFKAEVIADIINSIWLDPEYEFVVRKREK